MVVVREETASICGRRTFLAGASGFYEATLRVADHASVVPALGFYGVKHRPCRVVRPSLARRACIEG